jgi:ABC-type nitrate/sulfonate/bicarbonate transport system ATPase subunit
VLRLGWFTKTIKIVLPSAIPMMFTGLRLSLGIGWMVLIAAEMLAQNPGLGKFVWDEFQNGSSNSLARIMVAVLVIGFIGFLLDRGMLMLQRGPAGTRPPCCAEGDSRNPPQWKRPNHEEAISTSITRRHHLPDRQRSVRGAEGRRPEDPAGRVHLADRPFGLRQVHGAEHRRRPAHASSGGVLLENREVTEPGPDRAVVFQNHSLLPWLSVYGNVRLAVDQVFKRTKTRPSATSGRGTTSSWCTCRHALDRKPDEISGGMKQRVGIARALAMEPKVLLMDEPFGALDSLTRTHMQDSLMEIQARLNNTVLMITHDVDEAVLLSDRIVMMTNGPRQRSARSSRSTCRGRATGSHWPRTRPTTTTAPRSCASCTTATPPRPLPSARSGPRPARAAARAGAGRLAENIIPLHDKETDAGPRGRWAGEKPAPQRSASSP